LFIKTQKLTESIMVNISFFNIFSFVHIIFLPNLLRHKLTCYIFIYYMDIMSGSLV